MGRKSEMDVEGKIQTFRKGGGNGESVRVAHTLRKIKHENNYFISLVSTNSRVMRYLWK